MSNEWLMRLGWTLLHFLWQGAGVALLLLLVLAVMRNRSSESRYLATLGALIVLVAFPVVTFTVLKPSAVTSAGGSTIVTQPIFSDGVGPIATAPRTSLETYLPGVVLFWAWGVCVLCVRMLGGLILVERLRRKLSTPAPAEWRERLQQLSERIGLKRHVDLLQTTHLLEPAAMGVFRATIVIPASIFARLAPEQLEAVLLHELAHVRRHDYLVNLLQTLVEALFFYHPAVWWVSSTIRTEREHCCDDIAVRAMGNPVLYVRALTNLEAERRPSPLPILSALGGTFMSRLTRLIGGEQTRPALSPIWLVAAMTAIAGGIVGFTTRAQAQAAPPAAPAVSSGGLAPAPSAPSPARVAEVPAPHAKKAVAGHAKAPKAPKAAKATAHPAAAPPAPSGFGGSMPASALPPMAPPAAAGGFGGSMPTSARSARVPSADAGGFGGSAPRAGAAQGAGPSPAVATGAIGPVARSSHDPASQPVIPSAGATQAGGVMGVRDATPDDVVREFERGSVVSASGPNVIDLYAKDGDFVATMLSVTKMLNISAVVMPGQYARVNLTLHHQPGMMTVEALCKAANATYRVEGGVYYFTANP